MEIFGHGRSIIDTMADCNFHIFNHNLTLLRALFPKRVSATTDVKTTYQINTRSLLSLKNYRSKLVTIQINVELRTDLHLRLKH